MNYNQAWQETIVEKTDGGWDATTNIELGPAPPDYRGRPAQFVLRIHTRKTRRGLETDANVLTCTEFSESHSFAIGTKGDYSRDLACTTQRATEKSVRSQHAQALGCYLETIIAAAKTHHGIE